MERAFPHSAHVSPPENHQQVLQLHSSGEQDENQSTTLGHPCGFDKTFEDIFLWNVLVVAHVFKHRVVELETYCTLRGCIDHVSPWDVERVRQKLRSPSSLLRWAEGRQSACDIKSRPHGASRKRLDNKQRQHLRRNTSNSEHSWVHCSGVVARHMCLARVGVLPRRREKTGVIENPRTSGESAPATQVL